MVNPRATISWFNSIVRMWRHLDPAGRKHRARGELLDRHGELEAWAALVAAHLVHVGARHAELRGEVIASHPGRIEPLGQPVLLLAPWPPPASNGASPHWDYIPCWPV